MTKIMNEGWAVYWHSTLMTRHLLEASEVISYADCALRHAVRRQPGQINPYKIGLELFRDIEERWNRGKCRHAEYERCDDAEVTRRTWDHDSLARVKREDLPGAQDLQRRDLRR